MPYHDGERRVQERAGVREMASRIGGGIRAEVPDRAAAFLASRRMLVVGTTDGNGRPWASVLTGRPGFARAPDPGTVVIEAVLPPGDPVGGGIRPGSLVGTLAIDFATRRRARVNGVISCLSANGFTINVDQAYANCPKYIQRRADLDADENEPADALRGGAVRVGAVLAGDQVAAIARADTFFIATSAPASGADVSHRGGNPGFVRVTPHEIVWPDYAGNSMFNTLGNIDVNRRAGLAFVDFDSGHLLQVSGAASIDWYSAEIPAFPGAERLVRLRVERVVESKRRLPTGRHVIEYSSFNPVAR